MGAFNGPWPRRVAVRWLTLFTLLASVAVVAPVGPAAAATKTPPGDPPGNNGTIKVKKSDPAADPNENNNANQPHISGCVVWLSYSGFDQGQTADITFTAQPPSGKGEVLVADTSVPVSNDAAGGGQDQDAVIAYNLTSAVQNLKRQPNQGYHIKIASDTKEAPGGAKQKVFWIDCGPAAASTLRISKAVQGTGAGPFAFAVRCNHRPLDTTFTLQPGEKHDVTNVPAGTTCITTETDAKGAQRTDVAENPPSGSADGTVKVGAGTPETVTFTNVFPGNGGTPAPSDSDLRGASGTPSTAKGGTTGTPAPSTPSVLGETVTRPASTPQAPATLPRTGEDASGLVALGLWAASTGALARTAGRGRRRQRS
jgi:hypothetical protein